MPDLPQQNNSSNDNANVLTGLSVADAVDDVGKGPAQSSEVFERIDVDTSVPGEVTFNNYAVTDFDIFFQNAFLFLPESLVFEVSSRIGFDSFSVGLDAGGITQYNFADGLTLPAPTILQLDGDSVIDPETEGAVFSLDRRDSNENIWVIAAPEDNNTFSPILGTNQIITGDGDDTIYVRSLSATINGGFGNDTYIYNALSGASVFLSGETAESGEDDTVFLQDLAMNTVSFRHDSDAGTLSIIRIENNDFADPVALVIEDVENIENILFEDGTRIENLILGDNLAIDHPVKDGLKYLYGTNEDEWIVTGEGLRDLYAHGGDDVVYGNADRNNLNGGFGNDIIFGGSSNDALNGAGGDDILYGQRGNDVYWGGAGADTFVMDFSDFDVFVSAQNVEFRNNRLRDFDPDEGDVIRFEDIVSGFDPLSDAIGDFIQLGERSGKSTLLIDRDGTGTFADFQQMVLFETQTGGALQVDFTVEDLFANGNLEIV